MTSTNQSSIANGPPVRSVIVFIFGCVMIVAILWGLYVSLAQLLFGLSTLDAGVAAAIVAACATVLVSAISLTGSRILETRSLVFRDLRDKKVPVYERAINFIYRMFLGALKGESLTEQEMIKGLAELTEEITVWGSDDVVKAYGQMRRSLVQAPVNEENPLANIFLLEDLILAIRRDLGHKNNGLKAGDILVLFVNDIDKYVSRK